MSSYGKTFLGSYIDSWANDGCVPIGTPKCFNLERGYCRFGDSCPFSHSARDIRWKLQAILNLNRGVVWIHLGKNSSIPNNIREEMENEIGKISRIDIVRMPGNPAKGGQYWCAVVYFAQIKKMAFQTLASGNCIHFEKNIRVQLFRGYIKPKEEIIAKQAAQNASIQSAKAIKSTIEAVDTMNLFLMCMIQDYNP